MDKLKAAVIIISIFCPLVVFAAAPGDVIISEIKTGDDGASTNEFIELFNRTANEITLDGFILKKKTQGGTESNLVSASKFIGTIPANGYFLVAHPDYRDTIGADLGYSGTSYSFSANNTILLYDANNVLIDKVGFGEAGDFEGRQATAVENGQSISRKASEGSLVDTNNNFNDFLLTNTPHPQNRMSPAISSDSITVESEDSAPMISPEIQTLNIPITEPISSSSPYDYSNDIILSEFLPNPYLADDKGEFIELYNKGEKDVDLTAWRIGDESGNQFTIPTSTIIKALGFFTVFRPQSRVVMDNDSESVKLYKPMKTTATETVKYKNAPESFSYSRDPEIQKRWTWSYHITPSSTNVVEPENNAPEISIDFPDDAKIKEAIIFDASDTTDPEYEKLSFLWNFGDGATSSLETAEHTFQKSGTYKVVITVKDGKNTVTKEKKIKITSDKEDVAGVKISGEKATSSKSVRAGGTKSGTVKISSTGASRKVSGTVVSLPGGFGVQYFYIFAPKAVQVYNYKKDFPELILGDIIEVSGTQSVYAGMPRIKTTAQENIEVIENGDAPEPGEKKTSEIQKEILGELIKISGEVTGKKGQSAYIDDGSGEAEVYIKKGTNISMGNFTEGENITVTGLVMPYKIGFQLWPRSVEDVVFENKGEVLGISASSSEWELSARSQDAEWMKYLLIIMGGVIVVLGGFVLRGIKVKIPEV